MLSRNAEQGQVATLIVSYRPSVASVPITKVSLPEIAIDVTLGVEYTQP
jgi:hypothetical protein